MKNENWSDIWLFLAVARTGGLTGAAEISGSSAATVGRRMLSLETSLARRLFHRKQTGYDLTEDGRAFLDLVLPMEEMAASIGRWTDKSVAARRITISAGHWVTRLLVQNHAKLRSESSQYTLEFVAMSEAVNISRREADIGVRNKRPTQSGLAGQKLGEVQFASYRSKGSPDLHNWIVARNSVPSSNWIRANHGGNISAEVSDPRNILDLLLSGAGNSVLPTFVGDTEKGLERIGEPIPELAHTQYLVMHHDDRFDPIVREVINRVKSTLLSSDLSGEID